LQRENAELRTTKSELLTRVSQLQTENIALHEESPSLQQEIDRVLSRSVEELMGEVRTKLAA
jgi:hypothetical protein